MYKLKISFEGNFVFYASYHIGIILFHFISINLNTGLSKCSATKLNKYIFLCMHINHREFIQNRYFEDVLWNGCIR